MNCLIFYKEIKEIEKEAKKIAAYLNGDIEADVKRANFYDAPVFKNRRVGKKYDVVITIGGDGTLLHAEIYYPGILKLPLGAGKLEFLIEESLENWRKTIPLLLKNKYLVEKRFKISCNKTPDALNEFNLAKEQLGQMFEGEIWVDQKLAMKIRGDGLIIATPTGSTAYALACGSDVIHPRLETISIVPVAPFTLNNRPMIIPAESNLEIRTKNPSIMIVDGMKITQYHKNTSFKIEAAKRPARIIRFHNRTNFYEKLQLLK